MTIFSKQTINNLPLDVFEPHAALKYLECAICCCIISHLREDNSCPLLDFAVRVSGGRIIISVNCEWAEKIGEKAKECYILNNLKLPWAVEISDMNFLPVIQTERK